MKNVNCQGDSYFEAHRSVGVPTNTNKISVAALRDHDRCLGMRVCALAEPHRWTDAWTCGLISWRSVDQCSLLSLFPQRRTWRGRNSNASVSLSLERVWAQMEKGHVDQRGTWGAAWPLWSKASHVMPQCHTEHSDPLLWGQWRTLCLHFHLRQKDKFVAADVTQQPDTSWSYLEVTDVTGT